MEPSSPSGGSSTLNGGVSAQNSLCNQCQEMDLRPEDFIINGKRSSYRDWRPQKVNATAIARSLEAILTSRGSCSLCGLIARSTTLSDGSALILGNTIGDLSAATVSMTWEIDGRRSQGANLMAATTRRLHLKWSSPRLSDSYLVYVKPERHNQSNVDVDGSWDIEALFLGRRIDTDQSNESLILSWLRTCQHRHVGHCRVTDSDKHEMRAIAESSWFGVIDVINKCLTALPLEKDVLQRESINPRYRAVHQIPIQHAPFVALSYVWGRTRSSQYVTTRQNVLLRGREGELGKCWSNLPKTMRDAIRLVTNLGYRYLWVDALCIVQDSPRSWKLNADKMDCIYRNADFTICAADGESAEAGLVAWDTERRVTSNIEHIQVCGHVKLMATQLSEQRIRRSEWNRRAWTFQERMLSRRCLVFCEGRVFFQCRSAVMSEDIVAEPQGGGWSLELAQAPHQMFHDIDSRPMLVYMELVPMYTARYLTKQEDILTAFGGITNVLKQTMDTDLVYGLPASHFDLALLWQPTGNAVRRASKSRESDDGLRSENDHEFPSWSWCGWVPSSGVEMVYDTSYLSGCLDNVNHFLTHHTWNKYFIRDNSGELRPLWNHQIADRTTQGRWKGYPDNYERHAPQKAPLGVQGLSFDDTRSDTSDYRQEPQHQGYDQPGSEMAYSVPPQTPQIESRSIDVPLSEPEQQLLEPPPAEPTPSTMSTQQPFNSPQPEAQPRRAQIVPHNRTVWVYERRDDIINNTHHIVRSSCPPDRFTKPHADSPYRVKRSEAIGRLHSNLPDQPILQFWALHVKLKLSIRSTELSPGAGSFRNYDVLDETGDWCGVMTLDRAKDLTARWTHSDYDIEGPVYEFIAMSAAKSFTEKECSTWTYYIPKNREQSEWEAYHCLLVELQNSVRYRVGIGKVFQRAFRNAVWKEIVLG